MNDTRDTETLDAVLEITRTVVSAIVDDEDRVNVVGSHSDKGLLVEVKVGPDDVGKIIGKEGRIASAIRTVVKAVGAKYGERVMLNVFNRPLD
jgi:hypothetical protein